MSSITPAPWTVVEDYGEYQVDGERMSIAVCSVHNPRSEANAYLIAAAPDLLSAVEKCLEMISRQQSIEERVVMMEVLTNALKKVKRRGKE
jgi:hypothetical protein